MLQSKLPVWMLQLDCADGRIESGILSEGGGGMGDVSLLLLVQIERESERTWATPLSSSSFYSAAAGLRQTDLVREGLAPAGTGPPTPPHPAARAKPSPPTDRPTDWLACMFVAPLFIFCCLAMERMWNGTQNGEEQTRRAEKPIMMS